MLQQFTNLAEKVAWTYVQSVLVLMTAGDALNIALDTQLLIAALPAALTVVANGLPASLVTEHVPLSVDVLYRVLRSGVVAFLGFLLAQPVFSLSLSVGRAAWMAGLMAALVTLKGVVASRLGYHDTAATLPARLDIG